MNLNGEWLKEFIEQAGIREVGGLHAVLIITGTVFSLLHHPYMATAVWIFPMLVIGGGLCIATNKHALFKKPEPPKLPPPSPEVLDIMHQLDEELGITDELVVTPMVKNPNTNKYESMINDGTRKKKLVKKISPNSFMPMDYYE